MRHENSLPPRKNILLLSLERARAASAYPSHYSVVSSCAVFPGCPAKKKYKKVSPELVPFSFPPLLLYIYQQERRKVRWLPNIPPPFLFLQRGGGATLALSSYHFSSFPRSPPGFNLSIVIAFFPLPLVSRLGGRGIFFCHNSRCGMHHADMHYAEQMPEIDLGNAVSGRMQM